MAVGIGPDLAHRGHCKGAQLVPGRSYYSPYRDCVALRPDEQKNGPDDGLVATLDEIIKRRVDEVVVEAEQSPETFESWELRRINGWAETGYTLPQYLTPH